jgi:hypothetical protein
LLSFVVHDIEHGHLGDEMGHADIYVSDMVKDCRKM